MAATVSLLSSSSNASASTTLALGNPSTLSGDWLVAIIATSNSAANGAVDTCTLSSTNVTWTTRESRVYDPGAADEGTQLFIATGVCTGDSGSITATFGSSTSNRIHQLYLFRPGAGETASFIGSGAGSSGNANNQSITSVSVTNGHTIFCAASIETNDTVNGDPDTTNGSWSSIQNSVVNSGTDATSQTASSQYKTVTATGNQFWSINYSGLMDGTTAYVILNSATANQSIIAQAGTYALTGTDASLEHGREVAPDAGSYAVTGTNASLILGHTIAAGAGSYALTGSSVSLLHTWKIVAGAGSYALTGQSVQLGNAKVLMADAGSYAISGTDVALQTSANKSIAALSGTYIYTGSSASLTLTHNKLVPESGVYAITGINTDLIRQGTSGSIDGRPVIEQRGGYAPQLDDDASRARQDAQRRRERKARRDAQRLDDMIAAYMEGRQYIELPDRDPEDPVTIANVAAQLAAPPWARISFLEGALEAVQEKRAIMQAAQAQRQMEQEMDEDDVTALLMMD